MQSTLKDLLTRGADGAIAISAPSRNGLTFGALRALIDATIARLNALGIGRNDRVAIVLPNGPEMATCFVACASGVASAPLNPGYRADEFEFYLADLNARALIVDAANPRRDLPLPRIAGARRAHDDRGPGRRREARRAVQDLGGQAHRGRRSGGRAQDIDAVDVERGRGLELEALVGAVVEIARITGTPTPKIDAIHAATKLLAHVLQEHRGRLEVQPVG